MASTSHRVYEFAKNAKWNEMKREISQEPSLVNYAKPGSLYTLLHQAAHFGETDGWVFPGKGAFIYLGIKGGSK